MSKRLLIVMHISMILMALPAMATVITVPGDQPTIRAGIDAAVNEDPILVAPGTYYENINFRGKNIVVASHYILDGETDFIETTIINGSHPSHPDTGTCVLTISGEDSTAVLQGFTLTKGTGTKWFDTLMEEMYREGG